MNPTGRFSNRVSFYAKYRPGYPAEVVNILAKEAGLNQASVVADIGSGTGISTRLFLPHVARVYAVEPNAEMRAEAERESAGDPKLISVNGTAEATGLPSACADFVAAATAFHWFRELEARAEFRRILKPGTGLAVLLWNMRKMRDSELVTGYEEILLRYCDEYKPELMSQNWNAPAEQFFCHSFEARVLDNFQEFDYEGLQGRLLSASYAPLPGHPNYEPMMADLRKLFDRLQTGGRVRFDYDTHLYWGRLSV